MPSESISVIVPARDAAPTLERTLTCLARQRLESPFEVVVVDDGSRDATAWIARRHAPLVRLVEGAGRGPGAARNAGVAHASGRVLAFTDADCFPTESWLEAGLAALAGADLVQGRVMPDPAVPRTPFDRSLAVDGDRGFYQTANLFLRREDFERIGGFQDWSLQRPRRRPIREDRRRGRATRTPIGEDTDLAWRLVRAGARSAFAPDALVLHEVVPGGLRDAMADRWHWTRDMPGLVARVPELREFNMYRRFFFAEWTAHFDLALLGIAAGLMSRRRAPLLAAIPYLRRLERETRFYRDGRDTRVAGLIRALRYLAGAPLVDATTLAGHLRGGFEWGTVVL